MPDFVYTPGQFVDARQGTVKDMLDQEIRYFCGLATARVLHRERSSIDSEPSSEYTEVVKAALRTRIRAAIDSWESSDVAPVTANTEL